MIPSFLERVAARLRLSSRPSSPSSSDNEPAADRNSPALDPKLALQLTATAPPSSAVQTSARRIIRPHRRSISASVESWSTAASPASAEISSAAVESRAVAQPTDMDGHGNPLRWGIPRMESIAIRSTANRPSLNQILDASDVVHNTNSSSKSPLLDTSLSPTSIFPGSLRVTMDDRKVSMAPSSLPTDFSDYLDHVLDSPPNVPAPALPPVAAMRLDRSALASGDIIVPRLNQDTQGTMASDMYWATRRKTMPAAGLFGSFDDVDEDDEPISPVHDIPGVRSARPSIVPHSTIPGLDRVSTEPPSAHPEYFATFPTKSSTSTNALANSGKINPPAVQIVRIPLFDRRVDVTPIVTEQIAGALKPSLPVKYRWAKGWKLAYSLGQHGISYATLMNKLDKKGACVIAVQDVDGNIFGGYASDGLRATTGYYGSGEW